MPRNPDKQRCAVPGCNAWAMRPDPFHPGDRQAEAAGVDAEPMGHLCRSHLDHLLGPRGGGGQPGNLNAVRSGKHANPFPADALIDTALQLIKHPGDTPLHLHELTQSIHRRTNDPIKTVLALQATLGQLSPLLHDLQFQFEMVHFLKRLPAELRQAPYEVIVTQALRLTAKDRLRLLRAIAPRVENALKHVLAESPGPVLADEPGPVLADEPGPVLADKPGPVLAESPGPVLADKPGPVLADKPGPVLEYAPRRVIPQSHSKTSGGTHPPLGAASLAGSRPGATLAGGPSTQVSAKHEGET